MWLDPEDSDEDANGVSERWVGEGTQAGLLARVSGRCMVYGTWRAVILSSQIISDARLSMPIDLSFSSRISGDRIGEPTYQEFAPHTPKPSISSSLPCSLNHLHLTVQMT